MKLLNMKLLTEESIVHNRAYTHWCILLLPTLLLFLSLYLFTLNSVLKLFLLITVPTFLVSSYITLIKLTTSRIIVTNKRVFRQCGWFKRNTVAVIIRHIDAIEIEESLLGRCLGYGYFKLIGGGGNTTSFHWVQNPKALRYLIQGQNGE